MEVREGYKKTEVGVIPEDWECAELGELIQYVKGFAFKSKDYTESGIRIIRVSDTTYNSIKDECAVYMDISRAREFDEWKLYKNDIILSTVGSKPPMFDSLVGKAILVSKKYEGALLNQNAVILRSKKVNQKLIYNNLKRQNYIKYIETIFRGNANQASITLNDLFKFQFALPIDPIEQQAITEALSDVDDLISSLTKLINKKKSIMQGAMQELLTGKKRLDGFSGDWDEIKLGMISKINTGKKNNDDKVPDGIYPFFVRSKQPLMSPSTNQRAPVNSFFKLASAV
jgi:type I restriction enzyme S subunit